MTSLVSPVSHTDVITQSNYQQIATTHLAWNVTVDWAQRIIRGHVVYDMEVREDDVDEAIFDASFLVINSVSLPSSSSALAFSFGKKHKAYGSALKIQLERKYKKGETVQIKIDYSTTDECTALGWLSAEQTDSGKYGFFYSQCQACHARALLPVQDTPALKLTYTARIASPLPILLSALRTSPPLGAPEPPITGEPRVYEWHQPIAIPSYLIAIAGGELAFKALGERTGIWAEPGVLEKSAWEFEEDAEKIVSTLESLLTPYVWGRYDALVLPSSFPYGGMENPNMTFLTPALVVGDRSQVDVLAHECAHSWHGNSIGCADWDSFWLNEGWTTYTERLVALKFHGSAARDFEYVLGAKSLKDDLERFEKSGVTKGQRLHIPYVKGEDPDDLYSGVAYDKGANFLYYLEKVVGGLEVFNPYHKAYIKEFTGKSLTTAAWEKHFWSYWSQFPEKEKLLRETVDWDAWLNGEGLELPVKMEYDLTLATSCYDLASRWSSHRKSSHSDLLKTFHPSDVEKFSATQTVLFLETLGAEEAFKPEEGKVVEALGEVYGYKENHNPEIKLRWFLLSLKAGLYAKEASVWIRNQGRMKYARPTYRALNTVDPALAKKTFLDYGVKFLHPIARTLVAKDLGLEK